jgi:hypothetical protein
MTNLFFHQTNDLRVATNFIRFVFSLPVAMGLALVLWTVEVEDPVRAARVLFFVHRRKRPTIVGRSLWSYLPRFFFQV